MCCTLVCRCRNLIIQTYTEYGVRGQSNELELERGLLFESRRSLVYFPMPLLVYQRHLVTDFMHLLTLYWVAGRTIIPLPRLSCLPSYEGPRIFRHDANTRPFQAIGEFRDSMDLAFNQIGRIHPATNTQELSGKKRVVTRKEM